MSGLISTLVVLGVVAVGGYFAWTHKDEILAGLKSGGASATADVGGAAAATGEYGAAAACDSSTYKVPSGGGYNGTPGWYTISGHHHCTKGEAGCVCTDPKKCLGKSGTGSELCKGGGCTPCPGQCRPDLGRYGATPCGDCPPGTGGGACAGNGAYASGGGGGGTKYKAPKGKAKAKKGNYARSFHSAPLDQETDWGGVKRRIGYYDVITDENDNIVEYVPTMFALSNEKMSCW